MSEFPLYPNNCHHDEMPERCWRCLESELTEARARLTEAQAQNESRGLALLAEQVRARELESRLSASHARETELCGVNDEAQSRIEELEAEADRIHADRVRLADKCRELESRNAAEKAALVKQVADALRKKGDGESERIESLGVHGVVRRQLKRRFYDAAEELERAWDELAALTPAPDAKGAVK